MEVLGIAHAVETRHRRHHNHIAATGQQRRHRAQSQTLDLVVDHQVLLDVFVRGGYVGFGLIVVVIRDEILDAVVGEEVLELAV